MGRVTNSSRMCWPFHVTWRVHPWIRPPRHSDPMQVDKEVRKTGCGSSLGISRTAIGLEGRLRSPELFWVAVTDCFGETGWLSETQTSPPICEAVAWPTAEGTPFGGVKYTTTSELARTLVT